jgi:hypothetical protein
MFSDFRRSLWIGAATLSFVALLAGCVGPQRSKPAIAESPVQSVAPIPTAPAGTNGIPEQRIRPIPSVSSSDTLAPNLLSWDANFKEYLAKAGETNAHFAFRLTNISSAPIIIYATSTSCECTVAQLPTTPWTIPPGGKGKIEATIELPKIPMTVTNYVVVYTSKGNKLLLLKATAP